MISTSCAWRKHYAASSHGEAAHHLRMTSCLGPTRTDRFSTDAAEGAGTGSLVVFAHPVALWLLVCSIHRAMVEPVHLERVWTARLCDVRVRPVKAPSHSEGSKDPRKETLRTQGTHVGADVVPRLAEGRSAKCQQGCHCLSVEPCLKQRVVMEVCQCWWSAACVPSTADTQRPAAKASAMPCVLRSEPDERWRGQHVAPNCLGVHARTVGSVADKKSASHLTIKRKLRDVLMTFCCHGRI